MSTTTYNTLPETETRWRRKDYSNEISKELWIKVNGKWRLKEQNEYSTEELKDVKQLKLVDLVESIEYGHEFSSSNYLSDKVIEHSLPVFTQFDKMVNHCLQNKLDIKDYIMFNMAQLTSEEEEEQRLQKCLDAVYNSMLEILRNDPMGYVYDDDLDESGFTLLSTTCGVVDNNYDLSCDLDGGELVEYYPEWEELYKEYQKINIEAEQLNVCLDFGK